MFGENIPQDINKAINYFTLAADHHNSEAQYFLGDFYLSDEYVPIDFDKAIYYYQNKQDINKAINYLALSANQNYMEAQFKLGTIYLKTNI